MNGAEVSTQRIPSAMWQLNEWGVVDIHDKFPHDGLHNDRSGVTVFLVEAIKAHSRRGAASVREIDARMSLMPRYEYRYR